MSSPTFRTTTRQVVLFSETITERYPAPEPARPVIETTGETIPERPLAKASPRYTVERETLADGWLWQVVDGVTGKRSVPAALSAARELAEKLNAPTAARYSVVPHPYYTTAWGVRDNVSGRVSRDMSRTIAERHCKGLNAAYYSPRSLLAELARSLESETAVSA